MNLKKNKKTAVTKPRYKLYQPVSSSFVQRLMVFSEITATLHLSVPLYLSAGRITSRPAGGPRAAGLPH